jgi:hypothetical protein
MKNKAVFWLKLAFLLGVIVDGLAVIPMAIPWAAKIFWGFEGFTGIYYFAMGMGATFMLAWTLLLLWAYQKPIERRAVALLTAVVLAGFMATEVVLLGFGYINLRAVLGSLVMQPVWLFLQGYAYFISGRAKAKA